MNTTTLIKNVSIVNEHKIYNADVLIKNGRIEKIGHELSVQEKCIEMNAEHLHLLPGCIDDQVHFREPGLTHKGEIYTEAKAAVAGGITSYMEMPNTNPQTITQELLAAKYQRASMVSLANYSFFMGVTNHNYEEVVRTNPLDVCGIKIFMGSSTGDMLVDDENILCRIFGNAPTLIAVHCEDEATVKRNLAAAKETYGEAIPVEMHPNIRSEEACYLSSSLAVALAKKKGTRLHVLHISTARELSLFDNALPLADKKITSEACVHHLYFTDEDYKTKGSLIKWNPAVKTKNDRDAIRRAVIDNTIDIIATDHAPHTLEEKAHPYLTCPSGGPLVQHALPAMLDAVNQGWMTLEKVVEKMAHSPAICFQVENRGFIREGYFADLVVVDLKKTTMVSKENILYKCGWSPFEGSSLKGSVVSTYVNGHRVYHEGVFDESKVGQRLSFIRK
ncbi:MAG: dihydroorotase [Bacteroidota bacterium]